MQRNLRERAAPQQLEQALLHSVCIALALRFNKNCDMENFEEQLRKDLHQFLLSMNEVDERMPECPDEDELIC